MRDKVEVGILGKPLRRELDTAGTVSGAVRSDRLSSLERDLLKGAMAVVKRFKAIVRNQFHLEGT